MQLRIAISGAVGLLGVAATWTASARVGPRTLVTGAGDVTALAADREHIAWLAGAKDCGPHVHVLDQATGRIATVDQKSCKYMRIAPESSEIALAGDRAYWNQYEVANTEMTTFALTASVRDPTTRALATQSLTGCETTGCWPPAFARAGLRVFFSTQATVELANGAHTKTVSRTHGLAIGLAVDGSFIAVTTAAIPPDFDAGDPGEPPTIEVRSRRGKLLHTITEETEGAVALVGDRLAVGRSVYPRTTLSIYALPGAHLISTTRVQTFRWLRAASRLFVLAGSDSISTFDPATRRETVLVKLPPSESVSAVAVDGNEVLWAQNGRILSLPLPRAR